MRDNLTLWHAFCNKNNVSLQLKARVNANMRLASLPQDWHYKKSLTKMWHRRKSKWKVPSGLSFITGQRTCYRRFFIKISISNKYTLLDVLLCSIAEYFYESCRYIQTNNFYLPSAVFIAQILVGHSKQLKQIIQIEHMAGRRQTCWLFTSVAEDLNSRLPRNKSR